jgi:lipopolysaccharide biosynthesis glycosyltransferase
MKSGIVHYNGAKPWNGPCLNMDIWWDYYRRSPFFDEKFCYDFWNNQRNLLVKMPLLKRIKLLLRYPLDRR